MTKKCKWCQKDIDPKIKKCPHCGTDQRNWFGRHPVTTGILVVVIILSVLGAFKYFNSSNQEQTVQNQQPSTSVRHDNTGAGAGVQEDSSGENHMQRIMDHLGL